VLILNDTAYVHQTMASEIILPTPAMESIHSFLDARDLATMAQTCKTWQRIVYRKSVWTEKNISYRSAPILTFGSVPPHARHLGTPTETCFLNWLKNSKYIMTEDLLPVYIEHNADPAKFMKATRAYWMRHGCPCEIPEHHRLQDMLRIPFPRDFSKADRQRVLHRLIIPSESTSYNVYSHYLELLNRKLSRGGTLRVPSMGIIPDASDPLHRLWVASDAMLRARYDAINAAVAERCAKNSASFTALARHGRTEFEANDVWFVRERDAVWSTAGFSYKKI
jgi:hypothetical protein